MDNDDWENLLSAAARLQKIIPEAVLVGGTASALWTRHRFSHDADHVIPDLRERFDAILAKLEAVSGWRTARVNRPVQILGSLDGIDTGIRQLIRTEPLETERIRLREDLEVTVPTRAEILRIKGALILKRNAARDYIDFAALSADMDGAGIEGAMRRFDQLYPQPNGESPLMQLQIQLAAPKPHDLEGISLAEYKGLAAEWRNWEHIETACLRASFAIADILSRETGAART
ncbi:MAG: nucleotidyl transferase AbiEii/AbiGii toxin family protein [Planctomycetota bacterium]|jgi:hypothetical protein|nr:nucleotidyl transferase AbiEii/AbiGii toxin family protein [Planctomycetota bacterium]